MNQYIIFNGLPHRFVFSIHSDFLPSQFVSFDLLYLFLLLSSRLFSIFDLPLPLFKSLEHHLSIFLTSWLISHLWTCPNHLKRLSFIFFSIFSTPKPFLIYSFQILFFKVSPLIHSKHLYFRYFQEQLSYRITFLNDDNSCCS